MLRDGLNHVLCRKRRDAIRRRAPEFHRWQSRLRLGALPVVFRPTTRIDSCTDHEQVRQLAMQHLVGVL